jgi:hypothetical protein
MIRLLDIKVQWLKNPDLEDLGIDSESNKFWKPCKINPDAIAWVNPYELNGKQLTEIHFTGYNEDVILTNIKWDGLEEFLNK